MSAHRQTQIIPARTTLTHTGRMRLNPTLVGERLTRLALRGYPP